VGSGQVGCGVSDLTAVSLFAGIEGFGLALERCGVTVKAAVEIDPDCRGVIARRFPQTALFNDVTEVTGDQLRAAGFVPERGIITAGFPCQDLSIAGRRAGLGGARSGLFWHIVRLARELRPQWLLLENVHGLLSAVCSCPGDNTCTGNGRAVRCGRWDKQDGERVWVACVPHIPPGGACAGGCMERHGGAMGTVLGALGNLGYGFAYRVLDSQFFGVAQRRERVFIVGCLGDRAAPVEVLLEPESGEGHSAAGGAAGPGTAGRTSGSAGRRGELAPALTAGWGTNHGSPGHGGKDEAALAVTAATLQGGGHRGHRVDAEGAAGGHLVPFGTSSTITARQGKGPDSDMTNGFVLARRSRGFQLKRRHGSDGPFGARPARL
jgi:DNA (cytosine-5)-methyltransferase 1